jgi:hypothetical protein
MWIFFFGVSLLIATKGGLIMSNFTKKIVLFSLLLAALGSISPAYAKTYDGEWDWSYCIKKDGSSFATWWGSRMNNKLLRQDSSTAHRSIGGYVWLSGHSSKSSSPYILSLFYLTDGSNILKMSKVEANDYCKELVERCKNTGFGADYEYIGAGRGRDVIAIPLTDATVREPNVMCPNPKLLP